MQSRLWDFLKIVQGPKDMQVHVQRIHVSKLIIVKNYTLLLCRCSDVRSRGDDDTVRNRQPFDTGAKLRIHKLAKHPSIYPEACLEHLKPKSQRK